MTTIKKIEIDSSPCLVPIFEIVYSFAGLGFMTLIEDEV